MKRILLFSGKGGVGKTTVAAATAVAAARLGHRTLLLSFDLAHSLADVFGLDRTLFDQAGGHPTPVAPQLEIQEIDVQTEVESGWREAGNAFSLLLAATGVQDAVVTDLAFMPGMEDLITLLHINRHAHDERYDLMLIDCPPTGDSLRFVSLPRTIDWYLRKRFALKTADAPTSAGTGDASSRSLLDLRRELAGVEQMLQDSSCTSVRLVTLPERMVIRESQRAFMYFSLFGLVVDRVIVNRVFPALDATLAWRRKQEPALLQLRDLFDPIPLVEVPYFTDEMIGLERLHEFARYVCGEGDPLACDIRAPVFRFEEQPRGQRLVVAMPFVDRTDLELHRENDCLIVRVGSFKRHIPLPRPLQDAAITSARIREGALIVEFEDDSFHSLGVVS